MSDVSGSGYEEKIKAAKAFSNTKEGFEQFTEWVEVRIKLGNVEESYVMKATGVCHEQLAHFLSTKEKTVHIVLPLQSKRYLQSLGLRSKTGRIDAKGLAMTGCEQELGPWR